MLLEFDSNAANGPRSSAHYDNDGWYGNNYVHFALVVGGAWPRTARARELVELVELWQVGTEPEENPGTAHGRSWLS